MTGLGIGAVPPREAWQQALVIFEDLQHPDAENVRAKINDADERAGQQEIRDVAW